MTETDNDQGGDKPFLKGDAVFPHLVAALQEAGVEFTQVHHRPVYTSTEAAEVRGTSLSSGAKALILKGEDGFLLAVMPADLSLDSKKFRKEMGWRRLRFATKEEVVELTGLTPGSIPPFGSLFGLATICDHAFADNDNINFNAGSHTDSIQMCFRDFATFESPRILPLAKPVG